MSRIFYKSKVVEKGNITIEILNKGDLKKSYPQINTEALRVSVNVQNLTEDYPIGTIFCAEEGDYSTDKETTLRILNIVPLLFKNAIMYSKEEGVKNVTQEAVEHYFTWYAQAQGLSDLPATKKEVKKIATLFKKEAGWKFDLEALLDPKLPETIEEVDTTEGITLLDWARHKYPKPTVADCGMHIPDELWERLVRNILRVSNTILVGPTGSGKTEIVELITRIMGLKLDIQDMGTVQDAQSALLGVHRLNSDNQSIFDPAPFVSHIQSPGVVLLDEMNR